MRSNGSFFFLLKNSAFFNFIFVWFFCANPCVLFSQTLPSNQFILEEYLRRGQLVGKFQNSSFLTRPFISSDSIYFENSHYAYAILEKDSNKLFSPEVKLLPISMGTQFGSGNPYPEGGKFLQAKGYQQWVAAGIYGSFGPISIQFQPEFIFVQNKNYNVGISKERKIEYIEIFGKRAYSKLLPGQSSVRLNYGSFSVGASTENIWWGPGQYNSLLFSNNAFGFQHFTFNTRKPAKTFLGSFEGQLILGKLNNFEANLIDGKEDWRYVNGITFSYQPKWFPGFFFGASRVFQQYSSYNDQTFGYYFPIFEPFQKKLLINPNSKDFNSTEYDGKFQSQQLAGFARLVMPEAKAEIYFEYGRRDHAVDWREFILNPEHARAYLFGFKKLIYQINQSFFQVNAEILHQQESINILTRYGPYGGASWAAHDIKQGFTHQGQMLGPGIGPSSNSQTLETSWVNGLNKIGIRWERLNRHQDIFIRLFSSAPEKKPWIDYSARILFDWARDDIYLSSSVNLVYSNNQQWELSNDSTPDFPTGTNKVSAITQIQLIYFLEKKPALKRK